MAIISILPKTYSRLISKQQSKKETINSIINRLIDESESKKWAQRSVMHATLMLHKKWESSVLPYVLTANTVLDTLIVQTLVGGIRNDSRFLSLYYFR